MTPRNPDTLPPLSLLPGDRARIPAGAGGVLDPRSDLVVLSTRCGKWALRPSLFFCLAQLPDWKGFRINELGAALWTLHAKFNFLGRGLFFGRN